MFIHHKIAARLAVSRAPSPRSRRALTKLELLVAVALGVFVVGFLIMLLTRHRENSLRVACSNNLRVIGLAVQAYHDKSAGDPARKYLPPSRIADRYATWAVLIAPHLVKESPLHRWDVEKSYFVQEEEVRQARLFMYFCPARRRADTLSEAGDLDEGKNVPGALGDYAAVAGDGSPEHDWTGVKANGALVIAVNIQRKDDRITQWSSQTSLESLTRGTQFTLLVGEKHVPIDHYGDAKFGDGSLYNGQNPASFSRIAGPGFPIAPSMDAPFNNNFGSAHDNICNFLMADASVRSMTFDTSEIVLGDLARRGE
jgi:hypothetical protein